jgi:hypothetical protein
MPYLIYFKVFSIWFFKSTNYNLIKFNNLSSLFFKWKWGDFFSCEILIKSSFTKMYFMYIKD